MNLWYEYELEQLFLRKLIELTVRTELGFTNMVNANLR